MDGLAACLAHSSLFAAGRMRRSSLSPPAVMDARATARARPAASRVARGRSTTAVARSTSCWRNSRGEQAEAMAKGPAEMRGIAKAVA